MATYTTPSLVRKRLKWIDPGITDADINAMIEQAEGVIDATMNNSIIATFDANKSAHQFIRSIATSLAAYYCLSYNVTVLSSTSSAFAGLQADILWADIDRGLKMLQDARVKKWIEQA